MNNKNKKSGNNIISRLNIKKGNSKTKYSTILECWLKEKQTFVKESTYAHYFYLINKHIKPYLGHYQLNEITTSLLEQYVQQLLVSGNVINKNGLSQKTTADIISVVRNSLSYAEYHGHEIVCKTERLCTKKEMHKIRIFNCEEIHILSSYLVRNMSLVNLGILISLYTGIRLGELCALKWENIDINNKMIKIRHTMQRIQNLSDEGEKKTKIIITLPKSYDSIRNIPVPDCIIPFLLLYEGGSADFFLTNSSTKLIEPRTMQNRFKRILSVCNIDDANYHTLRHTFATKSIELGFDIKTLSEILGHSNVNITLNRYVHSSFELKQKHMNKWSL